jgi:hypothetical protein
MQKVPQTQSSPPTADEAPFPPETVQALHELGELLRKIHHRLVSEGWTIKNGEFIPPASGENQYATRDHT